MKSSGFTFIEVILVLMIIAIVAMIPLIGGFNFIERHRMTKEVNQIILAIQFARSAAIQYGTPVTLCKSADQKTCSGQWKEGQIVFLDPLVTGKVESPQHILRTFSSLYHRSQLQWRGFYSHDFISFDPSGIQKLSAGSFTYSPSEETPEYTQKIILNRTGRVRIVGGS